MASPDTQKSDAIATHSRQAPQFETAYGRSRQDPHGTCFTYSRLQLDKWLDRLLPVSGAGLRLLDVGCGTGHQMAELRARGFEVAGVDGSEEMLEHARRHNPGAELQRADVESLPFPSQSFDVTLSIEVLRYLPDPAPALREMARVLRPGGVCVATAAPLFNLNGYWLVNRVAAATRLAGFTPLKQFFSTSGQLRRAALDAGFGAVEVHGVYLGPINWIERLAPRALRPALTRWEKTDSALADKPGLRELANMFVLKATRS